MSSTETPEPSHPNTASHARRARATGGVSGTGRPPRRRRRWPWIVGGTGGLLVVLGIVAAVLAAQFAGEVRAAKTDLEAAKSGITQLSAQLSAHDTPAVQATASDITRHVQSAAHIVDGPLWHIAAAVPVVGRNVDAVQSVTRAVDTLVDRALPAGLHVMTTVDLNHLTVQGGGINLAPFRAAQASLPQIADAFTAARRQVAGIDTRNLLPQVAGPVDGILHIIRDTAPALDLVNRYLPTMLDMAGASGTQTYLVIFQNNAEIRATGGNPAAGIVLRVSDGRMTLDDQVSDAQFYAAGTGNTPWTPLPAEVTKLYPATFPIHSQDFTMTPDFPTAATLFENLWKNTMHSSLDGVISIDPVVLSHMLAVAGPVTLPGGEQITAQNAVQVLLSDAYARYPNGAQSDAFFAEVAAKVFAHLTSASWNPLAMLGALEKSATEQRVYVNFTDPKAQALATELGVDGALSPTIAHQTQLGMYLNDSSVGKLEYYLTTGVTLQCDPAARTVTETMTLHNSIPDSVTVPYVLGARNPRFGISPRTMMLDVVAFAPPGARIVSTTPQHGQVPQWERTGVEKGNSAVSHTVFVPQGGTVTVSYTVQLPGGTLGPLDLRHTPTATATKVTVGTSCSQLFPKG